MLQLHSRRVYRKLKCNHKTLPKKRTPNATNPSNYHSCNTISHPNWATCPLQQLLSPQGAIFTGGVSASIWENYQKTTDDTGKPLQLHLGTTTFTALLKMKVPNGGVYSDATEEPFWLLKYSLSTSRNQVLVQSQCYCQFLVGSTREPFKNRLLFHRLESQYRARTYVTEYVSCFVSLARQRQTQQTCSRCIAPLRSIGTQHTKAPRERSKSIKSRQLSSRSRSTPMPRTERSA